MTKRWRWDRRDTPWFDQSDSDRLLERRRQEEQLTEPEMALLATWLTHGYAIVHGLVSDDAIDAMEADLESLWSASQPVAGLELVGVRMTPDGLPVNLSHAELLALETTARDDIRRRSQWRIHGFHRVSAATATVFHDPQLTRLASLILGVAAAPTYSINFTQGSEQALHQDTAVFHVVPPNYIVGAWLASEDISAEAGPLVIYPGSHRSPMYAPFDNYPQTNLRTSSDKKGYAAFVEATAARFERKEFIARKGDILLWHGMLVHGGAPIIDRGRTRRSYVCHYIPPGMDVASQIQGPFNW